VLSTDAASTLGFSDELTRVRFSAPLVCRLHRNGNAYHRHKDQVFRRPESHQFLHSRFSSIECVNALNPVMFAIHAYLENNDRDHTRFNTVPPLWLHQFAPAKNVVRKPEPRERAIYSGYPQRAFASPIF